MSRGPPGRPGGVSRTTWRSGRGRESHPEVREGSRGPLGVLVGVGRPNLWFVRGREESVGQPGGQGGSVGPPGGLGGVGRPTQRTGRGR